MAYKILVVDDEPTIVRLMEFILARQGHEMLVAVNGEEALEKIRAHSPDLVLLDIMMPRIDGYEVARIVRADPATARSPDHHAFGQSAGRRHPARRRHRRGRVHHQALQPGTPGPCGRGLLWAA